MNENSEIHGPCRHSARFHRFESTDELGESEKSPILCQVISTGENGTVGKKKVKKSKKKSKTGPLGHLDPNVVPTHRTLEL